MKISVLIIAHNEEKYIAQCLESILNQTKHPDEIVLLVHNSTDKTLEIAESFGNRVTILRKGKDCLSQGVSSTRNKGLKVATQPYICFLDSDDFYLPNHLNCMASVLESNPELGFVFSRTLEVKEENGLKLFKLWTQQHISKNDILNPVVSRGNIVHTNCFLFRRVVFDKIGGFNEAYSNGEDQDLWMRISEQYRGAFSDHFGAAYRFQHEAGQLTNNSEEIVRNYLVKIYKNAIERYYQLGLKSSFRIFSLRRNLSNHEYKNFRLMYYLNYIYLIFWYPFPFLQRIPSIYSRFFKKTKTNDWYELSHFLKSDNLIK